MLYKMFQLQYWNRKDDKLFHCLRFAELVGSVNTNAFNRACGCIINNSLYYSTSENKIRSCRCTSDCVIDKLYKESLNLLGCHNYSKIQVLKSHPLNIIGGTKVSTLLNSKDSTVSKSVIYWNNDNNLLLCDGFPVKRIIRTLNYTNYHFGQYYVYYIQFDIEMLNSKRRRELRKYLNDTYLGLLPKELFNIIIREAFYLSREEIVEKLSKRCTIGV